MVTEFSRERDRARKMVKGISREVEPREAELSK